MNWLRRLWACLRSGSPQPKAVSAVKVTPTLNQGAPPPAAPGHQWAGKATPAQMDMLKRLGVGKKP